MGVGVFRGGAPFTVGGTPPSFLLFLFRRTGVVFEPVASPGDVHHLGMLEKTVEDGGGRRHVADQLGPVFQRSVGRSSLSSGSHDGEDDLQQALATARGSCFIPMSSMMSRSGLR